MTKQADELNKEVEVNQGYLTVIYSLIVIGAIVLTVLTNP